MSGTDTRQLSANQFCGNCGAAVKSYWNACAACHTPLEVRPVGSFNPADAAEPGNGAAPPTSSPRRAASGSPEANGGAGADASPNLGAGAGVVNRAAPTWPPAPDARPANPATPPWWSASAPERTATPASRSWQSPAPEAPAPPPSSDSWRPPAPQADRFRPPPPPPAAWAASGSHPDIAPLFPPGSVLPEPGTRAAGIPTPWIVAGVLAVLLLVAAIFGGVEASSASSARSHLSDNKQLLASTKASLAAANAALATAQSQLSDAKSTVSNQGNQLNAYKACIAAESAVDAALVANSQTQFDAARAQVVKACLPVGLS